VFVTPIIGYPPGSTVYEDTLSYLDGVAGFEVPPIPKSKAISHIRFVRHGTLKAAEIAATRGENTAPRTLPWVFGQSPSTPGGSSESSQSSLSLESTITSPPSPCLEVAAETVVHQRSLADDFFGIRDGASVG